MHEFSVMSYLLNTVEENARVMNAARVLAINLVIGDRSSIVDDSLMGYFEMMTPGTLAEGAIVNIRRIPTRFACSECQTTYETTGADFHCPTCGGVGQLTDEGSEFLLESIVIERA